tara:strand:+ start:450 stop:683 length:234 start_codon:yes stop_codon:yes gene_type:complete
MAQKRITSVSNISNQVVPIMLSKIALAKKETTSEVNYNKEGALQIAPGAAIDVESVRLDDGQLINLKNLGLISTTVR